MSELCSRGGEAITAMSSYSEASGCSPDAVRSNRENDKIRAVIQISLGRITTTFVQVHYHVQNALVYIIKILCSELCFYLLIPRFRNRSLVLVFDYLFRNTKYKGSFLQARRGWTGTCRRSRCRSASRGP